MRTLTIIVAFTVAFVLTWLVFVGAASIDFQEADLASYGVPYEINQGITGNLYISDGAASEIRHLDPTSGDYTAYWVFETIQDAKPDSDGNIWWTDGDTTFGRITVPANTLTTWDVPMDHNLWGLTFDTNGKVWMTEFVGGTSRLFRFDPIATELCTGTLPTSTGQTSSSQSYYILNDGGFMWIANWHNDNIYRIASETSQVTWWEIQDSESWPKGMALDGTGGLWWADQGLSAISHLDPLSNMMTSYNLPDGTKPQLLGIAGEGIWFTEEVSGTLGGINPNEAVGSSSILLFETGIVTWECGDISPTSQQSVSTFTGNLTWIGDTAPPLIESQGLTIYQLPPGSHPYGITYSNGYLWITDQGDPNNSNPDLLRYPKLLKIPIIVQDTYTVFIPLVIR